MTNCLFCFQKPTRASYRYCSNQCQLDYQYKIYISKWKKGEVNGNRGIVAKNISRHLRRYLFEKYSHACSSCGWSKKNLVTYNVPLEVDHIDGNSENNNEINLRLLCPNCHSLTNNFKSLNIGMGRSWRKAKYLKSNL